MRDKPMTGEFSITLRSAAQQAEFDRLRAVLADTLGLDWRGAAGEPDGREVADDCAESLWAAGFRVDADLRAQLADTEAKLRAARSALAAWREVREANRG